MRRRSGCWEQNGALPKGGNRSSCVTGSGPTGLEGVVKDLTKKLSLSLLAHWVSHFPSLSHFPLFKMGARWFLVCPQLPSKASAPWIPRSSQGTSQARLCFILFPQPQAAFIALSFPLFGAPSPNFPPQWPSLLPSLPSPITPQKLCFAVIVIAWTRE